MTGDQGGEPALVIGLVWPYAEWGGAQTHLLALARELTGRHRIDAYVPASPAAALCRLLDEAGVGVVEAGRSTSSVAAPGILRKVTRRVVDAAALAELVNTIRRHRPRPDALLVDVPLWSGTATVLALLRIAPVVQTFHTPMHAPTGSPRDRILRAKFRIVTSRPGYRVQAATEATASSLRPWIGDVAVDVIGVVDLRSVDEAMADDSAATRRELGVPTGRRVIGTLGQLVQRKGLDVLIDALPGLLAAGHDVHVLLGGAGPTAQDLHDHAHRRGLADRLTVVAPERLGPRHADQLRLVAALDVLVMPSRDEGLPLTLLEALALERPAVVSDVGAIGSVFADGDDLLLVPPGDTAALVGAVAAVLSDPSLANRLGRTGAACVRRGFDPVAAAAAQQAVLLDAVRRRGTRR